MRIELIRLGLLKEHEGVNEKHLDGLLTEIVRDGMIKNPIIVDHNTMVIKDQHHIHLPDRNLPTYWYNLAADIPWKLPLPINGKTGETYDLKELTKTYTEEACKIELLIGDYGRQPYIKIPKEVFEIYQKYRPTPLQRAFGLEKALGFEGDIWFKREDMNPAGSHKPNTSIPQAYYAKKQKGVDTLVTDTGAGQWGAAVALSCDFFGLKSIIFMTRDSYNHKPYRVNLMELAKAKVYPSPSPATKVGKKLYDKNPSHPGSLGIGMGEAMEIVRKNKNCKLALGCMSYYAVLHQTIIGLEVKEQLKKGNIKPDMMIACVGVGSNFMGFCGPLIGDKLKKKNNIKFIAVESANIPSLTKGRYKYDYQDYFGYTPMVKMITLGHKFVPPRIHSGGLRYHGKTPILSLLVNKRVVEPRAVNQRVVFDACKLFYQTEGIIAAPESGHAIAQTIKEAKEARKHGKKPTIIFCLTGNGYLDLKGYAKIFNLHV